MARIFTDGAEMGDSVFWDDQSGVTVQGAAPAPFGGSYYYKLVYGSSNYAVKNFAAGSEYYFRVRIQENQLNSAMYFPRFRTGTTNVAWLGLDSTFHWQASATTLGVLATSTEVMNPNQWYLIEIYYKEADAPNGHFVVYVDGNKIIDFTGDSKPATATTFDNIEFRAGGNLDPGCQMYIDDLALNDTSGLVDNSYPGDGIIVKITPEEDGTTNNWTGSDGDSTDNFLLVDEYPKDDDTTYVYHDGSISGHQDQYAMSHLSFTGYTILRIYSEARARKTAAAAHTIKVGTLASGGSDVMSAALPIYTNAYTRVVGPEARINPVDSNPWEETDIDALEFVVETG